MFSVPTSHCPNYCRTCFSKGCLPYHHRVIATPIPIYQLHHLQLCLGSEDVWDGAEESLWTVWDLDPREHQHHQHHWQQVVKQRSSPLICTWIPKATTLTMNMKLWTMRKGTNKIAYLLSTFTHFFFYPYSLGYYNIGRPFLTNKLYEILSQFLSHH